MTNATVFEADDQPQNTPVETNNGEAPLLQALVGEGQKYKSVDELAKAYANADSFIEQLKAENLKLREMANKAKTIDEVLERLQQRNVPEDDTPAVSGIKPEDVQRLVEQTLVSRESQSKREQNLLLADKLLKDKFGEKATEMFKAKANSPEKAKVLMELAAADPQEFASLFAGGAPAPSNNMDASSYNTTNVSSNSNRAAVAGTREWATEIRKKDPSKYWSHEFQYELQKMVTKNPSLYFGN
jgi:hypothetical protein